jgi:hypothetical protein
MKGLGTTPGKRTAEEHQEESIIQQQQRVASSSGSSVPWLLLGAVVLGAGGLAIYLWRRKP